MAELQHVTSQFHGAFGLEDPQLHVAVTRTCPIPLCQIEGPQEECAFESKSRLLSTPVPRNQELNLLGTQESWKTTHPHYLSFLYKVEERNPAIFFSSCPM